MKLTIASDEGVVMDLIPLDEFDLTKEGACQELCSQILDAIKVGKKQGFQGNTSQVCKCVKLKE